MNNLIDLCDIGRKKYIQDNTFIENYQEQSVPWNDPRYTVISTSDCYSNDFLDHLYQIWEIVKYYTKGGESSNKLRLSKKEISDFLVAMFRQEKIIDAYFKVFGYKGKYGLELAAGNARIVQKKLSKLPTAKNLKNVNGGIFNAINNGYWIDFGIRKGSFSDFLFFTFGVTTHKPNDYYKDKNGLENAKREMLEYKETYDKIPIYRVVSKEFGGIINAINEGYWKKFGISKGSFNEFLVYVFGEMNQYQKPRGIYKGKKGFNLGSKHIKTLHEVTGKSPTRKMVEQKYRGILYAINNGFWEAFGISKGSYNDFIKLIFGTVNKRSNGFYRGEVGLQRAIEQSMELQLELGRKPSYRILTKRFGGIITAITQSYWIDYGIRKGKLSDFFKLIDGKRRYQ